MIYRYLTLKYKTMKKSFTILLLFLFTLGGYSQEQRVYESCTYLNNVSVSEIPRFIELYKQFTDMSLGDNRTQSSEWLFRHWYGSGHTFVIYSAYDSMKDYHADTDLAKANINAKIKAVNDTVQQKVLMDEWSELASFWDNHTDEIRVRNTSTGFYAKEDTDFDSPFVMSVGRYNSSGSWGDMGNGFFNWVTVPDVDRNVSLAGGVSYHYMGSGTDLEVWNCYSSLVDFATAVSAKKELSDTAKEGRKVFWSLADGGHEDQIYLHIGHVNMEKGVFDLAGADR